MVKVVVLGAAGGIGQPLALLLKTQLPSGSSLSLYDVVPAITGVGVDLSHVNTNVKLEHHLGDMKNPKNPEVYAALKGADIVIIPAGVPRKPGMTRDDLFKINAGIVRDIIDAIAVTAPKALIGIITNPVNSTVPVAAEVLKKHGVYDPKRLFGVSTLDVVRAQTFIGELKNLDPTKVEVDVVGGHSPETMLTVFSGVKSEGKAVTFTTEEIKKLDQRIRDAGTEVVEAKQGAGSATLSMAHAGAHFVLSLVDALLGKTGIVKHTYVAVDRPELKVNYFALPVELGKEGVVKYHDLPNLSDYEKERLVEAVNKLKENIETGETFGKQ
jgi:malate dehydrogenase